MPRGGHFGFWGVPKTIFRSRWKQFHKRSHRDRTKGVNSVDREGPHAQPTSVPDGVPEPWRLQYNVDNYSKGSIPRSASSLARRNYTKSYWDFLAPADMAVSPVARDTVLRGLDPGRRGGAHSGLGCAMVHGNDESTMVPTHIRNALKSADTSAMAQDKLRNNTEASFLECLEEGGTAKKLGVFSLRRLRELCEEHEIVWHLGQVDPGRVRQADANSREKFPYVDEQASLVDDLRLNQIHQFGHRINSRRKPLWRAIANQEKLFHRQYLRRRAMNLEEKKAQSGVIKQKV
mmetsp:Transcript_17329/g.47043  ORF Transcript_17329/g.47043 Transcript_17329/m.47043 type:complete len:290 (-) Transcript_17329:391-1260(-)